MKTEIARCHNLVRYESGIMPRLHCDKCGCVTTLNVPSGGAGYAGESVMTWPCYCGNCGAKLEDK